MPCCRQRVAAPHSVDIGGRASYVPVIAQGLIERGHQVRVLTTSEREHLDTDDSHYPFGVVRMHRRLPLWRRSAYFVREMARWGRNADVIYANGALPEAAVASGWMRKPLVMKLVADEAWEQASRRGWTRDSLEAFQRDPQNWRVTLLQRLRSWYARRAVKIIVPCQYLKRMVVGWGVDADRLTVIYNTAEGRTDTASIPPVLPTASPDGTLRLLTAGRLIPLKGVDRLIRILPRLPRASLTVVGEGPCREEWQELAAAHGVAPRVTLTGGMARDHLILLMRKHDLFVLPSSHEGLPHAILEAMGQGLPVAASRVGGIPEAVEENVSGLLTEPDEESLYQALERLSSNASLRRRLAHQGPVTVRSKFSLTSMIEQTEAILLQVADRR